MSETNLRKVILPLACCLSLAVTTGCGKSGYPDLAEVKGTVTLDGKPLPKATVEFRPLDESVRGSVGFTDEQGNYQLTWVRNLQGAPLGKHKVVISTAADPETGAETKERVPPRYNAKTELTAEVTQGGGPYDFDLKSK